MPRLVVQRAKKVLGARYKHILDVIEHADIAKPKINHLYDIPYLAGSNEDGGETYIDKRLPLKLKVNGKTINPAKYLNAHEQIEHDLMEELLLPYEKAHFIAEAYEKAMVQKDGIDWMQYEHVLDGYINETEHEKIAKAPRDLYKKPYSKVLKNRLIRHEQVKNL